jgi:hypothetical protein
MLILACLCISNFALTLSTATLTGRVTDSNAAAIVGAKVDANNIDTNLTFSTVTNDEGLFVIPNLPPGRYRIFVQKDGFQGIVKPDVTLHVQDIISLSFSMQPGSIIQSVTVEGGAPLIQKESAVVGTVVDRQFVANLPLNGRSFQSLITLTPGVVLTKSGFFEQGQFSVNGQRANSNYFIVDGVSANIGVSVASGFSQAEAGSLPGLSAFGGTNNLVSVDALQEFKIQTSTYAPEFGRTPGAQVSIVTRSGTNNFQGTLFEYFRNDALDANDWFANSRGLPKPALRQNDFGGVLGGPLYLPRFGDAAPSFYNGKDRTFFFFSYEGLRLRQPQTAFTTVPSLIARQTAPASIQSFLNAFPRPNGRDLIGNFAEFNASYSNPATLNATSIRIDHNVSSELTLFGRYNYAPSDTVQRNLNTLTTTSFKTQTLTGGATWTLNSAISNELRANYSRTPGSSTRLIDNFGGASVPPDSTIFPSFASSQDSSFNLSLGVNSGFLLGKFGNNQQRQINLVNNLSLITGAHQLKFGADYRRLSPIFDPPLYSQQVTFNGVNGALTGMASQVSIVAFAGKRFPVFTNFSLFGQDTWKIKPRLTLTYGVRWEVNPVPSEANGNNPFAITGLDDPATLAFAPRRTPLYKTTYNNFAPRIGVGYQLSQTKGRETALRGGFGVFYDLGAGQIADLFANAFPNNAVKRLFNAPFPLDPISAAPPPFSLNPPFTVVTVADPHLKLPYTYQWNLAMEQSLGSNQTVSASYVAAVGRRLLRREILVSPNANFSFVLATRNMATSDYHGLQLQFQRRLSRGFQALASYTWSHSIDNASGDSLIGIPGQTVDPQIDRGPSDFDVRHAFSAAVTYDIPAPFQNAFANAFLRDFSIDAIVTARSAAPVNVITGRTFFAQSSISRPDLVNGVPLYIDDLSVAGGRRFNRAAFALPPLGPNGVTPARQGTLGRNALRGFPVSQVDLAIRRRFNLTETLNLQLRAEFFNVFNHPNFADPGAGVVLGANSLSNPMFGQSVQMFGRSLGVGGAGGGFNPLYQIGGPRSVQLAIKLNF